MEENWLTALRLRCTCFHDKYTFPDKNKRPQVWSCSRGAELENKQRMDNKQTPAQTSYFRRRNALDPFPSANNAHFRVIEFSSTFTVPRYNTNAFLFLREIPTCPLRPSTFTHRCIIFLSTLRRPNSLEIVSFLTC